MANFGIAGGVAASLGNGIASGSPLVNGYMYDYSSVALKVNGVEVIGQAFASIDYADNLPPGEVRGSSAQILGLSRGEYKAEGALEMPKDVLDAFLSAITKATSPTASVGAAVSSAGTLVAGAGLTLGGGKGYLEARFNLSISYADTGSPLVTDEMVGCKLISTRHNTRRTQDGIIVQLPLFVQYLVLNGKYPLSHMQK